ncbi:hypothetical protein FVE85_4886 [Porphyridium purpureum]|uniref:Uncharacterized protein n=1 Tax=Porphyridium purpureum TaxID=35688 RepID=A0A5J4YQL4_PORPP|nr:hypothetical protein FVE85_4886 [Porphyridium purpureum]|eukprot:POR6544..scf236_6
MSSARGRRRQAGAGARACARFCAGARRGGEERVQRVAQSRRRAGRRRARAARVHARRQDAALWQAQGVKSAARTRSARKQQRRPSPAEARAGADARAEPRAGPNTIPAAEELAAMRDSKQAGLWSSVSRMLKGDTSTAPALTAQHSASASSSSSNRPLEPRAPSGGEPRATAAAVASEVLAGDAHAVRKSLRSMHNDVLLHASREISRVEGSSIGSPDGMHRLRGRDLLSPVKISEHDAAFQDLEGSDDRPGASSLFSGLGIGKRNSSLSRRESGSRSRTPKSKEAPGPRSGSRSRTEPITKEKDANFKLLGFFSRQRSGNNRSDSERGSITSSSATATKRSLHQPHSRSDLDFGDDNASGSLAGVRGGAAGTTGAVGPRHHVVSMGGTVDNNHQRPLIPPFPDADAQANSIGRAPFGPVSTENGVLPNEVANENFKPIWHDQKRNMNVPQRKKSRDEILIEAKAQLELLNENRAKMPLLLSKRGVSLRKIPVHREDLQSEARFFSEGYTYEVLPVASTVTSTSVVSGAGHGSAGATDEGNVASREGPSASAQGVALKYASNRSGGGLDLAPDSGQLANSLNVFRYGSDQLRKSLLSSLISDERMADERITDGREQWRKLQESALMMMENAAALLDAYECEKITGQPSFSATERLAKFGSPVFGTAGTNAAGAEHQTKAQEQRISHAWSGAPPSRAEENNGFPDAHGADETGNDASSDDDFKTARGSTIEGVDPLDHTRTLWLKQSADLRDKIDKSVGVEVFERYAEYVMSREKQESEVEARFFLGMEETWLRDLETFLIVYKMIEGVRDMMLVFDAGKGLLSREHSKRSLSSFDSKHHSLDGRGGASAARVASAGMAPTPSTLVGRGVQDRAVHDAAHAGAEPALPFSEGGGTDSPDKTSAAVAPDADAAPMAELASALFTSQLGAREDSNALDVGQPDTINNSDDMGWFQAEPSVKAMNEGERKAQRLAELRGKARILDMMESSAL